MKFNIIHRIFLFALAAAAVLPIVISGELSFFLGPTFGVLWFAGWWIPKRFRTNQISRIAAPTAAALLFFFQAFRISQGEHLATASIEFAVLLLGIKLCTNAGYSDYQQTVLLAFVALIASTVTSYSVSYAFFFLTVVIFLPAAMTLTLLRQEMEQRFTKADEQTRARLFESRRIIQPRHGRGLALMVGALLLGIVPLFALLPRFGFGMGGGTLFSKQLLGFTSEVQIGDLSQTIDNETVYLRLWPLQHQDRFPDFLPLKFRGAVFDTFENGTWRNATQPRFHYSASTDGIYSLYRHVPINALQFKIMQEPTNPSYLFLPQGTHDIQMERTVRRGRLHFQRLQVNPMGVFKYNDAKRVGIRYTVTIDGSPIPSDRLIDMATYLTVPIQFQQVRELAQRWTANAYAPQQKIDAVLRHLAQEYQYQKVIPPNERENATQTDILQKFLFDYKRGTCEHFATAATLLLRSVGIPTRFVTGFSGARLNSIGKYYTVDANAAHAWTEVYLNGLWYAIDATPPGVTDSAASEKRTGLTDFVNQFSDTLAMKWHQYVMDYNETSQRALLASLRPRWTTGKTGTPKGISMRWILISLVLLVVGFGLYRIYRTRHFSFKSRLGASGQRAHRATELYLLLERRLRPLAGSRKPHETPTQYLNNAAAQLPHLREYLNQFLVDYLAARFGSKSLSVQQFDTYRSEIRAKIRPAASAP